MLNQRTDKLSIADGQIYYESIGQGTPLILCHAGFVDSQMWNPQLETLTQNYQVIRYDLRGYGQSDPATQPISRRSELFEIMDKLQIEKAILIGCSLSGATILDFALEHPEKVIGMVAVSAVPNGFEMQGEPPRYLFEMIDALQGGDIQTASELQTRIWFDGMYREPEQLDSELRRQVKAMNLNAIQKGGYAFGDAQPLNPLNPPANKRLAEITCPTLLIAGALDHPEVLRATDLMHQTLPNASQHIIENCAHLPNMEQAKAFNAVVSQFLRDLS